MAKIVDILLNWNNRTNEWSTFLILVNEIPCIKSKVIQIYKDEYLSLRQQRSSAQQERVEYNLNNFDTSDANDVRNAANWVWVNNGAEWVKENINKPCADRLEARNLNNVSNSDVITSDYTPDPQESHPFDRRLDRLEISSMSKDGVFIVPITPLSTRYADITTSGYLIDSNTLVESQESNPELIKKVNEQYQKLKKDEFHKGTPALQNYYAITRLYGSKGGEYITNQKGRRRWYEVDTTPNSEYNFTSTPTTSALISWGKGDPYGRTPYQFTDFVFCKYWNKIENNRLITIRRYAAPILDNLKFPGMISDIPGVSGEVGIENTTTNDIGTQKMESTAFPPMATAVTYFGGETGNSLTNILKFTTGLSWEDVQASVWEVTTDNVPDNKSGIGSIFGGLSRFAEMLNVAGGNFDREMVMSGGILPPDPYKDGPYENRIMGPVNRIDSVKKRKPGLQFDWSGISIVFEYVARPVGGINPKAVLLDIMSNFLVIGSASAVFFGGAHRFMANPARYPFIGGGKGIEAWYRGDPIGWGLTTIKQFTEGGDSKGSAQGIASNIWESMQGFFNQLFSGEKGSIFGSITNLFTGATGNIINNAIAKKTAGQVPYLQGMKAVLTGEPVGEWHVTVGNPLNPIAMIGNLVCENMTIEFNEELGPDDFPTEMKVTVKLNHAMARDRDAIESVFNRGMGRIYSLPDSFKGSADYQTVVDKVTAQDGRGTVSTGTAPNPRLGILLNSPATQTGRYVNPEQLQGKPNTMGGEISVWNRSVFGIGASETSDTTFVANENELQKAAYRTADWIAKRSLL